MSDFMFRFEVKMKEIELKYRKADRIYIIERSLWIVDIQFHHTL